MRYVEGNRLTLLRCGTEYFPALLASIEAAQHLICLETYIYANDGTGSRFTEALCQAAGRGVTVRLLVDGFGARELAQEFRHAMRAAGVQLLVFRPEVAHLRLRRHRLRRMHRKLAVIDGRIAYAGGINIIDDLDSPEYPQPRLDYALCIEGPLVAEVLDATERLWRRVAWASLRRRWRPEARPPESLPPAGTQRAALVIRDSLRHRTDIEEAYLEAIANARSEVIVANAYFFPGRRFRHALQAAAKRGVRVVLLLQGRPEYLLLHLASRALYGPLLDAGIEIHEYTIGFLHAKVAIVDDRWSTVGSSNIDPFSLLLAQEANIVIDDRDFAAGLREELVRVMTERAQPVPPTQWHAQAFWKKLAIRGAYFMVRVMLGLSGYGDRH